MDTTSSTRLPHEIRTNKGRTRKHVKRCETWHCNRFSNSIDSSSKSKPQFHRLKFDTLTVCISFWCEAVKKFTASLPKEASESKVKETRTPTSHLEHAKRQTRVEQRKNQDWAHAHYCLANLWAGRIKCRPARAQDSPCKPQQSHSKYVQQFCTTIAMMWLLFHRLLVAIQMKTPASIAVLLALQAFFWTKQNTSCQTPLSPCQRASELLWCKWAWRNSWECHGHCCS